MLTLYTAAAICRRRLATQANDDCCENGTFSAAIFSNQQICIRIKIDHQIFVAHEISQFHRQNFAASRISHLTRCRGNTRGIIFRFILGQKHEIENSELVSANARN